jgi:hypothetical protein
MWSIEMMLVSAQPNPFRRNLRWYVVLAGSGAIAFLLLGFGSVVADNQRLVIRARAAHDAVITGYARSNSSCDAIEPPELYLEKPPAHGTVCFRTGNVQLRAVIVGNLAQCLGRKVRGAIVVYLSHLGYAGSDNLRYTVIFPDARHSVEVDVDVQSDRSNRSEAPSAGTGAPISQAPQLPGQMPRCAALVS